MLLAGRSAQLVRLAARALCRCCENILVKDMLWPGYRSIVEVECRRTRRTLTTLPIQQHILEEHASSQEVVEKLVRSYRQQDCDGLFLSAVTHQGIRLPVRKLAEAAAAIRRPGFVVVDAAQAFSHAPLELSAEYCNLAIAGCHKWRQAYHPMGLGFSCRPSSDTVIEDACRDMLQRGEIDDPLLSFSRELEMDACEPFSETVSLVPLFTASAAVGRIWRSDRCRREEFSCQVDNTDRLAECSRATGWQPVRPDGPLRSGILLLRARDTQTRSAPADTIRMAFRRWGISLTAYTGGLIRFSMPAAFLDGHALQQIRSALVRCN